MENLGVEMGAARRGEVLVMEIGGNHYSQACTRKGTLWAL